MKLIIYLFVAISTTAITIDWARLRQNENKQEGLANRALLQATKRGEMLKVCLSTLQSERRVIELQLNLFEYDRKLSYPSKDVKDHAVDTSGKRLDRPGREIPRKAIETDCCGGSALSAIHVGEPWSDDGGQ